MPVASVTAATAPASTGRRREALVEWLTIHPPNGTATIPGRLRLITIEAFQPVPLRASGVRTCPVPPVRPGAVFVSKRFRRGGRRGPGPGWRATDTCSPARRRPTTANTRCHNHRLPPRRRQRHGAAARPTTYRRTAPADGMVICMVRYALAV